MDFIEYEYKLKAELELILESILSGNPQLNIASKGRPGAEISSFLESEFVDATKRHPFFSNSESAKESDTKNPWDAKTNFNFKNFEQEIWIDFKSFKSSAKNSNPAVGATNKMVKFINDGQFYLVYIYVYYKQSNKGIEFIIDNGSYSKIYLLKNINSSFWRDPTGQLQVNYKKEPEERTRTEFINLLFDKIKEGLERQLVNIQNKLDDIERGVMFKDSKIEISKDDLHKKNAKKEAEINNLK